jgi:hypothetical protein
MLYCEYSHLTAPNSNKLHNHKNDIVKKNQVIERNIIIDKKAMIWKCSNVKHNFIQNIKCFSSSFKSIMSCVWIVMQSLLHWISLGMILLKKKNTNLQYTNNAITPGAAVSWRSDFLLQIFLSKTIHLYCN